jgi:ADP-ribose pyrophosphatase YjhB (NUDIX family)
MSIDKDTKWLYWARELQSMSQTGLTFSRNEYENERYKRLAEIAAEMLNEHSELEKDSLIDNFLAHPGYATPKVDVRSVVMKENKILLVQEKSDERWALPGGWADVGDVPSEAAERETWEESGFIVKANKLIGAFDANRDGGPLEFFHAFKLIFLCDLKGGEKKISTETIDVDFFDIDDLPPLSPNRTDKRHIEEIKQHLKDPKREAYFD